MELTGTSNSLGEKVRGMTKLDRSMFTQTIQVPGIIVNIKSLKHLNKCFKKSMLKMPNIKAIADLETDNLCFKTHKLLLLDRNQYKSFDDFSEDEKGVMTAHDVDPNSFKMYSLETTYDNLTWDDVLKAVLPTDTDGVGGFSTIGHIVHLNLKDNLNDYKFLIGEVLVDKIKTVKTVINKTNTIDTTFRNFSLELLGGEDNMITINKENGCSFEMDFSKVYWNPKLGNEHARIISQLSPSDIVYDMMAGIGPFAIPASRKQCIVFANDLNPESFKWLEHNVKLNTSKKYKIDLNAYNMDGRDFIRNIVKMDMLKKWKKHGEEIAPPNIHIIMNLPAIATQFLDVFKGLYTTSDLQAEGATIKPIMPTIHCYCFCKSEDQENEALEMAELGLRMPLPEGATVHNVRNVAPKKDMMCVEFRLTDNVLICQEDETNSPQRKKMRTDTGGDI
ncbi:unnamed protein product [Owenia fusiformis]|uniref:tRNA (guanine(37)-N1)-methyltransferase n=2 Tax=Owenia fusiformis TaxID=6347 RepID=A0A8J1XXD2_OWEFU|nr:unnamed protein product [Owenia fusiformis]